MFVRTFVRRNKDGSARAYLYLVRNHVVDGKERQELVGKLGRLDVMQVGGALDRLIASLARHSERCWVQAEADPVDPWRTYGPVLIFRRLWEQLGLAQHVAKLEGKTAVQFPLEEAAFAMVLHRLLDPGSKRRTHRWMHQAVYWPEFEAIQLHHLYRALGYLVRAKEEVEENLFAQGRDLFSLDVDLVLFDTTTVYFEGDGPDGLAVRGRPGRDHPRECTQLLLGLVLTREGYPVAHHVFPGNTADINAFRAALKDLRRRFPIRRVVVVGDRGMISEEVVEELDQEGVGYILATRLRKSTEVRKQVLSRAGRYREVGENLRVKEVRVGDRRYVVCHNPLAEERDRHRRAEILERARRDLATRGPKAFVVPQGLKRYVELRGGELVLKEDAVREEARYDGKWVLRTNTDLPTDELALAYKSLWQVEHAFRELKSGLEIRPVFLRVEDHVRGHILVCFLALVLEATLQRLLAAVGSPASYQEVLEDLCGMQAVRFEARGRAWLWRTELPGVANQAFRAAGVRPPPRVRPLT